MSAVYKKTTNLKLHFFSNHEEINRFSKKVRGEDPDPTSRPRGKIVILNATTAGIDVLAFNSHVSSVNYMFSY